GRRSRPSAAGAQRRGTGSRRTAARPRSRRRAARAPARASGQRNPGNPPSAGKHRLSPRLVNSPGSNAYDLHWRLVNLVARGAVSMVVALVLAACAAGPGGSAAGGSSAWTEVSSAAALTGVSLLDIAAYGGGFVAVGNAPDVGGAHFGGAFTSIDGSIWMASPTAPFKDTTTNVVGKVSNGLLALGSACSVECFSFKAWVSPDGAAWTGPTAPPGDESRPTGFAQHRLVIVAISSELADPAKNLYKGYVYLSNDGRAWAATPQAG